VSIPEVEEKAIFCAGGSKGDLLVDVEIVGRAHGSTCLKSIFKQPGGSCMTNVQTRLVLN